MNTENTTATTTEAQPKESTPTRITLKYLLDSVETCKADRFEEWALDFYSEAQRRLAKSRTRLWRMERLGLAPEVLAVERTKLNQWEAQMVAAQFLAQANTEEIELDYTSPRTLLYFAIWLWDTDHCRGEWPDPSAYTYGPLEWALYLDEELLNLPSFGLR